MEKKSGKWLAYAFIALLFIVVAAAIIVGLWVLRTDLTVQSILVGTLVSIPMTFGLLSKLNRSGRVSIDDTWKIISDRSLTRFLQAYTVIFLAVTVVAYFKLNFVAYIAEFLFFTAVFSLLIVLLSRYSRHRDAQGA